MTRPAHSIDVHNLSKHFPITGGILRREIARVHAVDNVSFHVGAGETVGLVGESGCGKSTIARMMARLTPPTSGSITVDGEDIATAKGARLRDLRRNVQMVFQDPYASLNPRMRARTIVEEPLWNYGVGLARERRDQVEELFRRVGLRPDQLDRYPHEFSGGQRQRLGIARALALRPKLMVLDEPVSALDVSVQAQVINLLSSLQQDLGLSFLFVAHDLAVVEHISHRVAVMYLGRIVEIADRRSLFKTPTHPYTRALLASVPKPDPKRRDASVPLSGELPSPLKPPSGCRFRTRCPLVTDRCAAEAPKLAALAPNHHVACHVTAPA